MEHVHWASNAHVRFNLVTLVFFCYGHLAIIWHALNEAIIGELTLLSFGLLEHTQSSPHLYL